MPVQLIHGDNLIEIQAEARRTRARFHPADVITLEGSEMTFPSMAEACLTAGLFEPERIVIVRDLHTRLKNAKPDSPEIEEVTRIMGSMAPTTTLLLISPGMTSEHALHFSVRSIGGTVKNFGVPRSQELAQWIQQHAGTLETSIDFPAAELLVELVGPDTILLNSELQKLATYAGRGRSISAEMVDELVGQVTQASIFALVDAVANGQKAAAFRLLQEQLDRASGGPIDVALYVIRMLARQIRILLGVRLAQAAGRKNSQIIGELKLPRYYADRYFRQASRLSVDRLRNAFEQLAKLEFELKSGQAEPATGLDLLVADLCR